jgi:cell division ATPase FtsA
MHFFPDSRKNKKNKKEVVLILDIGSGSVAGSFVEFNIGQDPRVLYVKRVPIKLFLTLSGERFKKAMLESLSITLNDLNKNGLRQLESYSNNRVKKVYCSLASPWFVSQTKTLVVKEDKEFTITAKFISDLLQKEEDSFENSNLSKYSSNKRHASEVIERKLIDVRLNGYKVKDPIGKKAQSAEFDIFLSMSQATILDSIEDVLSKYFLTEEINFHSFTLVSFSAIRDIYESVSSFLFLDITGEVTDISIIKLGTILKTASFPVGKNSVIREVTKTLKTLNA